MSTEMGICKEGYLAWSLCKYIKIVYKCLRVFECINQESQVARLVI